MIQNNPDNEPGEALKACPFCAGEATLKQVPSRTQSGNYWWIGCEIRGTPQRDLTGCGIGHSAWSKSEVIAKWNTRRASVAAGEGDKIRDNLEAIITRCTDGDPSYDWRPIIERLAREALAAASSPLPAEPAPPQNDSCSHWREGDTDNCVWCGDDLGPTTEADVAAPAQPEGEQEK